MQIFALFDSMNAIDLAVSHVKQLGINSRDVFVVPFGDDDRKNDFSIKNTLRRDAVDRGFAFATGISVITAGIGFKLYLGPIIWGLIGAFSGFLIGYFGSLIIAKKRYQKLPDQKPLPFIMIINSKEHDIKKVEEKLFESGALGVNTPLWKDSIS